MTADSENTQPTATGGQGRQSPRWHYVLAVTSLAVFIVGVMLWGAAVDGYVASVTVRVSKDAKPWATEEMLGGSVTRQILSDDCIRSAIIATRRQRGEVQAEETPSGSQIAHVRDNIELDHFGDSLDATKRYVEINFVGQSPHEAVAFADQLAGQFVQWHAGVLQSDVGAHKIDQHALEQLVEHQNREAAARDELMTFLEEHFTALRQAAAVVQEEKREAAPKNPVWVQLQDELGQLKEKRAQFLIDRTESHPTIRELNHAIGNMEQLIERVPRFVEAPLQDDGAETPTVASRDQIDAALSAEYFASTDGQFVDSLKNDQTKFEEILARYDEARAIREQSEEAVERQRVASDIAASNKASHIEVPAHVTQRLGGPTAARILLIGLAAMVAGVGMARMAARLPTMTTLDSVEEVEQTLALPVVGTIADTQSESESDWKSERASLVRGATFACEIILAVVVFLFVVVAVIDSPVLEQFAHDPFGATSEAVGRVISLRF